MWCSEGMKKLALLALLMSCTDNARTVEVLEAEGYSWIETTGWSTSCSDDDTYCTGFVATSPDKQHTVRGAVGCGQGCGKGCTVRIKHVGPLSEMR